VLLFYSSLFPLKGPFLFPWSCHLFSFAFPWAFFSVSFLPPLFEQIEFNELLPKPPFFHSRRTSGRLPRSPPFFFFFRFLFLLSFTTDCSLGAFFFFQVRSDWTRTPLLIPQFFHSPLFPLLCLYLLFFFFYGIDNPCNCFCPPKILKRFFPAG